MQLNIVPYTYEDFKNRKIGDVFIKLNDWLTKEALEKGLDTLDISHFNLYKDNGAKIHKVAIIRFRNLYDGKGVNNRYLAADECSEFTSVDSYPIFELQNISSYYYKINEVTKGQYLWKIVDPTIEEFLGAKLHHPNITFDHGECKDAPLLDEALRYRIQVEIYHKFIKSSSTLEFTTKSIGKVRTKVRQLIKLHDVSLDKVYPDIVMWTDDGKTKIRINYKIKEPKFPKPIKKSYNRFSFLPKK